jgi:hypothetical protein
VNGRRPLTHDLLLTRTAVLLVSLTERSTPPRALIMSRIACDGCGAVVNLRHAPWPQGWTTEGDLAHGFDDRCEECSR